MNVNSPVFKILTRMQELCHESSTVNEDRNSAYVKAMHMAVDWKGTEAELVSELQSMIISQSRKEDTRRYYHSMSNGTIVPDEESMVAFLIDAGVLFVNSRDYLFEDKKEGHTLVLYILCNDQFCPGSDGEDISYDDVPKLFELYRTKEWQGVYEFVAAQRGYPDARSWKEKLEENQKNLSPGP